VLLLVYVECLVEVVLGGVGGVGLGVSDQYSGRGYVAGDGGLRWDRAVL
jgi:hypothetical protein